MRHIFATMLLVLLTACIITPVMAGVKASKAVTSDDAKNAIEAAHEAIIAAYDATWKAEEEGADVSKLVENLNLALNLTEAAQSYYEDGDFTSAYDSAVEATNLANETLQAALKLRDQTIEANNTFRNFVIILSVFIASTLSVFTYYGWLWWKERNRSKLLKMRPKEAVEE